MLMFLENKDSRPLCLRAHIELLDHYKVPYVLVDYHEPGMDYCVYVDDYTGSNEAVSSLVAQGHRHIAYISGFPEPGHPRDFRLAGYRQALEDAGLPYDSALVACGRFDLATGAHMAPELLQRRPDLTAIACGNDLIALGAFRALREAGYRIPEDISLIGFDDVYLSTAMEPRLSTVRQPAYELGIAAVNMLGQRVRGEDMIQKTICFRPTLILRDTVARAAGL